MQHVASELVEFQSNSDNKLYFQPSQSSAVLFCSSSEHFSKEAANTVAAASARMEEEEGIPGLFSILPDGSVARSEFLAPSVPADESAAGCMSRDVVVEPGTGLQARLFLPTHHPGSENRKLQVIVYVHGGGFCMLEAATVFIHDFCVQMALTAQALVVSVDYRRAPEHRLPAAYEDCSQVLKWLTSHYLVSSSSNGEEKEQIPVLDPWILSCADLSRCFLMGESSGANILHHVMLRGTDKLLKIEALILVHPFFGAEERTPSEIKFAKGDLMMPMELCDEMWRHCLPIGANRDHPFCNPFNKDLVSISEVTFPRTLVVVGGRNSLQDRQVEYFNFLKESGKDVLLLFLKNAVHAFEFVAAHSEEANIMLKFIVQFMAGRAGGILSRSASLIQRAQDSSSQ